MQGCFNIHKLVNVIQNVNKLKKEKSYDHVNKCRKHFDRTQNPFNIQKTEENVFSLMKAIYKNKKLTANIKVKD